MNISLNNISKKYNQVSVLRDLSLELKSGGITCIMGPSGSGKTTLLRILMGLTVPDSGSVYGLVGKKISVVFQEDRLLEYLDAVTNIKLVCGKEISIEQIVKELECVDLYQKEDNRVSSLSGGMKRRVAIVRAVLAESDVLIMDEPFKGLDETLKLQVMNYVKERTKGKTVVLVTHDKEEAEELGADVIYLGKLDKESF